MNAEIGTRAMEPGREALLVATVHVVARKGLRGLTFRAVAEHAGVNNSLVAHHFGTRDSLIKAALDWSVQQSIGLSQLEETPRDGRRVLRKHPGADRRKS